MAGWVSRREQTTRPAQVNHWIILLQADFGPTVGGIRFGRTEADFDGQI